MALNYKKNEEGSILIFTVLILNFILAISLSLGAIFVPKIKRVSEGSAYSTAAIYSADSAIEWCIYINQGKAALPAPSMANGATFTINPSDCAVKPLNHQAVGTFKGVSRALEVNLQ